MLGRPVSANRIQRWVRRGCRGVVLEHTVVVGGRIIVTEAGLRRFVREVRRRAGVKVRGTRPLLLAS
jgi:hypothetical protein